MQINFYLDQEMIVIYVNMISNLATIMQLLISQADIGKSPENYGSVVRMYFIGEMYE